MERDQLCLELSQRIKALQPKNASNEVQLDDAFAPPNLENASILTEPGTEYSDPISKPTLHRLEPDSPMGLLQKELAELEKSILQHLAVMEQLQLESESSRNRVEEIEKTLSESKRQYEELINQKTEAHSMDLQRLESQQQELENLRADYYYTQERIQELEMARANVNGIPDPLPVEPFTAQHDADSQERLIEAEEHISTLEQVILDNTAKFESILQEAKEEKNKLLSQLDDFAVSSKQLQERTTGLGEEITRLKKSLEEKQQENAALQNTLEENSKEQEQLLKSKNAELEMCKIELETSAIAVNNLKDQLESAIAAASQWEQYSLTSLADQEAYYQKQLELLQTGNADGDDSAKTADTEALDALRSKIEDMAAELARKADTVDELTKELSKPNQSLLVEESLAVVSTLYLQIDSRPDYEVDVLQQLNVIAEEWSRLQVQLSNTELLLGEQKEALASLDEQLLTLRQDVLVKEELYETTAASSEMLSQSLSASEKAVTELQQKIADLEAAMAAAAGIDADCQTERADYAGMERELEDAKAQLENANLIIQDWQQYASTLETQLQEATAAKESGSGEQTLGAELRATDDPFIAEEAVQNQDSAEVQLLLKTNSNLAEDLHQKESEIAKLQEAILELENIRSRYEMMESERNEYQQNANAINEALRTAQEQLSSVTMEMEQLQAENASSARELQEYVQYCEALEQEKNALLQQLFGHEASAGSSQQMLQGLQNEVQQLKHQLDQASVLENSLRSRLDEAVVLSKSKDIEIEKLASVQVVPDNSGVLEEKESTIQQLQEEFDELAVLFQNTNRELEEVKANLLTQQLYGPMSVQQDAIAVSERTALNKLISSLETEKKGLSVEISKLKSRLDHEAGLLEDLERLRGKTEAAERKILDYRNREADFQRQINGLELRTQALEEELFHVHDQLRDSDRVISSLQADLQKSYQSCAMAEERCRLAEIDLEQAVLDRDRSRDRFEMDLVAEQQHCRDTIHNKMKELRSGFDLTLDEMHRKQNQLEQLLDESERALVEERTVHHQREQALVEEIQFYRDSNGQWPGLKSVDHDADRLQLDYRINDLLGENRQLQASLESQHAQFLKERHYLLAEIDSLKQQLQRLETSNGDEGSSRTIKKLQEEKRELEGTLRQNQARLARMEELATGKEPNERIAVLGKQVIALETILAAREAEVNAAETKLNHFMNSFELPQSHGYLNLAETDKSHVKKKLQEALLKNKQLVKQLAKYQTNGPAFEPRLAELSELQFVNDELVLVLSDLFSQTIGADNSWDLGNGQVDVVALRSLSIKLVQEVLLLRQFTARLSLWRSDLLYQKRYLTLKIEDLEEGAASTLLFLKKNGIKTTNPISGARSPLQRLRKSIFGVLAVVRMRYCTGYLF
ncbi:hypothetical protein HDV03_001678 [Kappamyces sp. JEL0829]|nr:hypothetical protein HDV03_001678 [Kappamyces sp. JEL0829]